MARRSMAESLAEEKTDEQSRAEMLALKKRALGTQRVTEFIKRGDSDAPEASRSSIAASTGSLAEAAQLNTRIPAEILLRLKRAAFENKMSNLTPDTLQGIVAKALDAELRRLGY